jgi:hypothetical protein
MDLKLQGKNKEALFFKDLLMCQYIHPPFCGCFTHQLFSAHTPPKNINSRETSHNTTYYLLVV